MWLGLVISRKTHVRTDQCVTGDVNTYSSDRVPVDGNDEVLRTIERRHETVRVLLYLRYFVDVDKEVQQGKIYFVRVLLSRQPVSDVGSTSDPLAQDRR